jgi:hypothetical protein
MSRLYYLKVTRGGEVKEYPLDQPVATIGRSPDNSIRLDDAQVSRRHAEIECAEGKRRITDLGSRNGTVVNGAKIGPNVPVMLKAGDTISIGSYLITVRESLVQEKVVMPAAAERPSTPAAEPAAPAVKRTILPRGRALVFTAAGLVVILAFIIAGILIGGGQNKHDAIIVESATCLIDLHAQAIVELDSKLGECDQELFIVEEKLLQFDQVVTPCLEWIKIQKADALQEQKRTSWHYTLDQEELDRLKNEQYQVKKLELQVLNVGLPEQEFVQVIEIVDLTAGSSAGQDWEKVKTALAEQQESLTKAWETGLEKREVAMSTMEKLLPYWAVCNLERINSTTFMLTGEGMGWSGDFANGEWTYYRDRNEIIPVDNRSQTLMAILVPEP